MSKILSIVFPIFFTSQFVLASPHEEIQSQLDAPEMRFSAPVLLKKFYEARAFEPAWFAQGHFIPEVSDLLNALKQADREGLHPEDYHLNSLQTQLDQLESTPESLLEKDQMHLELTLTDAFLSYGSDLLSGRTNPFDVDDDWFAGRRTGDLPVTLEKAIQSREVRKTLESLLPVHPVYQRMRVALARYRQMEKNGGWPILPAGPSIQKGDRDKRLSTLRRRLSYEGDLNQKPHAKPVFDSALERGLKKFQARVGLAPDGILGKDTLKALNVPVTERVQQIRLNMERCRWLPGDLGERHIFVNVPSFTLHLVDNSRDTLSMKVVVGRKMRQTPVFSSKMTHIVFNPPWSVPVNVARTDILEHIQEEPDYLTRHKFEVFDGYEENAAPLDPVTVDWTTVTSTNLRYKFRQKSGPLNALGRIKFLLPNRFDVYLHDTPSRSLFSKTVRDFSSGCIRVEKPVELAEVLLNDENRWSKEKIEAAINESTEQIIPLPEPVPVHLMYWTAWVDERDNVQFREDIYGRDVALVHALNSEVSQ
ncbi:MAG: hypothetical protein KCHDKBKB_02408 [Elusimicrobia bacterium]|nr:hypothetical protein [Elusimicrobiota bacterium]